jgi:hypothetical protein
MAKTHLLTPESGYHKTLCGKAALSLLDSKDEGEFLAILPDHRCGQCGSLLMKKGGGLSEGGKAGTRAGPGLAGQAPVRPAGVGAADRVSAGSGRVRKSVQQMSAKTLDGMDDAGCARGAEAGTATDVVS